ncbi:cbb3-type cytochrome c oxidase subunit 3 [Sulfitobacter sp. AS59]|uniref:cbb3-type cytochrome c oxidase subunit 3 n=1 Tax=Sulfitobacter sp. AS59 TaxID=3135784 RepID=UPI00317D333E
MNTYSFLRELADSWVLLAMFLFFAGAVLWAFRPGSTKVYASVAKIPLGDDTKPKSTTNKGDDHV